MGGITALLLLAAGGINYGWKPDDQGGVEYVIQIPPDQLQELQRIGQVSSAIDPAVRGHVSRIVVQVGEGPLPRITPPDLLRGNSTATSPRDLKSTVAAESATTVTMTLSGVVSIQPSTIGATKV